MKRLIRRLIWWIVRTVERQVVFARETVEIESGNLVIKGNHTYGHPTLQHHKGSEARVFIGDYCSIGPRVRIITGGVHPADRVSTYPFGIMFNLPGAYTDGFPSTKGDVLIGNDVWISSDVTILSGVRIGDGAVIMAGAVVVKDVPPYAIVGGVPAKVVRKRMTDKQIEQMLKIKWWEWGEEKIREEASLLSSEKIDEFIRRNTR